MSISTDIWTQLTRQLFPPPGTNKNDETTKGHEQQDEQSIDDSATHGQHAEETRGNDSFRAMQAVEAFALCVGMPGAGKSSLMNTYLNPTNDVIPKPTVALEYMFARRASVANAPKVYVF